LSFLDSEATESIDTLSIFPLEPKVMAIPIKKILVFGGNGFVGQAVMKAALSDGYEVVGVSRRGEPAHFMHELNTHPQYAQKVRWMKADISGPSSVYKDMFNNETSVISCVGKIDGTDEEKRRVNGDANVALIAAAKDAGALRFVYISAYDVENDLPFDLLPGYFKGKRSAEDALKKAYASPNGVILQPGFVYGSRVTDSNITIPLGWLGRPMELVFKLPILSHFQNLPVIGKLAFSPPVSVHAVAKAAVRGATGRLTRQNATQVGASASATDAAAERSVVLNIAAINEEADAE
jgi:nucleoside-diphosphate-sugar epimerase